MVEKLPTGEESTEKQALEKAEPVQPFHHDTVKQPRSEMIKEVIGLSTRENKDSHEAFEEAYILKYQAYTEMLVRKMKEDRTRSGKRRGATTDEADLRKSAERNMVRALKVVDNEQAREGAKILGYKDPFEEEPHPEDYRAAERELRKLQVRRLTPDVVSSFATFLGLRKDSKKVQRNLSVSEYATHTLEAKSISAQELANKEAHELQERLAQEVEPDSRPELKTSPVQRMIEEEDTNDSPASPRWDSE